MCAYYSRLSRNLLRVILNEFSVGVFKHPVFQTPFKVFIYLKC